LAGCRAWRQHGRHYPWLWFDADNALFDWDGAERRRCQTLAALPVVVSADGLASTSVSTASSGKRSTG
jgi:hypothetical protein